MKTSKPIVVTGCVDRSPMEDRNGKPIHVGDRIRYQHCIGPYGQTAISETIVTQAHYQYGMIDGANFDFDFKRRFLVGYSKHEDCEHGHETWVIVL